MNMITIDNYSSKLKYMSVEMPNAPYSNRCTTYKETFNQTNRLKYD